MDGISRNWFILQRIIQWKYYLDWNIKWPFTSIAEYRCLVRFHGFSCLFQVSTPDHQGMTWTRADTTMNVKMYTVVLPLSYGFYLFTLTGDLTDFMMDSTNIYYLVINLTFSQHSRICRQTCHKQPWCHNSSFQKVWHFLIQQYKI